MGRFENSNSGKKDSSYLKQKIDKFSTTLLKLTKNQHIRSVRLSLKLLSEVYPHQSEEKQSEILKTMKSLEKSDNPLISSVARDSLGKIENIGNEKTDDKK